MSGVEPGSVGLVIVNQEMQAIYESLARIAKTSIAVLLLGETGAGKEVVAEWLHRASGRPDDKFVRINCAGLTETVVESELFGHERGAFTGATEARTGLFEAAHGGTLFLDEIAEMTPRTQAKVLRVLETGELMRVGAARPRRVDVRFVAATHRNLSAMISRGEFRQDLFFRLNAITVDIPPLRHRSDEIPALAQAFLTRAAHRLARPELRLSAEALDALRNHSWPGNVRELRNLIERAAALTIDNHIDVPMLALNQRGQLPIAVSRSELQPAVPRAQQAGGIRAQVRAFERARIVAALESTNGNQTRAAELLGLARRTLTKKLTAHGLGKPRRVLLAKLSDDVQADSLPSEG